MLVRGVGIGFAFMPAFVAAFAALERHELPDAAPQLNVLMRVGGSIGTARAGRRARARAALASRGTRRAGVARRAFGTAFWWSLGARRDRASAPACALIRARASGQARDARGAPPAGALPTESHLAEAAA